MIFSSRRAAPPPRRFLATHRYFCAATIGQHHHAITSYLDGWKKEKLEVSSVSPSPLPFFLPCLRRIGSSLRFKVSRIRCSRNGVRIVEDDSTLVGVARERCIPRSACNGTLKKLPACSCTSCHDRNRGKEGKRSRE